MSANHQVAGSNPAAPSIFIVLRVRLAQLGAQVTLNHWVTGSSPVAHIFYKTNLGFGPVVQRKESSVPETDGGGCGFKSRQVHS